LYNPFVQRPAEGSVDSIPYSELRAHLAETLKKLEVRDEPVFISRRGEPAAVLMSVAQYERLQGGPKDLRSAMLAWREHHAAEMVTMPEDEWPDPFADVRDPRPDGGKPALDWQAVLAEDVDRPGPKRGKAVAPRRPNRAGR
jgi:prevent-host-death family protein